MPAPNPDAEPDLPDDDLPDDAVEARWADIIAQLGPLGEPRADEPTTTDDAGPADTATAPDSTPDPASEAARATGAGPRDWPVTPEVEDLEETESHFTPPEPEPVLSRDPLLTLAWSLVVGIPVLVVLGVVVRAAVPALRLPAWSGPVAGGLFLVGLGVLLWRMPHHRDPDDHGTGAVV